METFYNAINRIIIVVDYFINRDLIEFQIWKIKNKF